MDQSKLVELEELRQDTIARMKEILGGSLVNGQIIHVNISVYNHGLGASMLNDNLPLSQAAVELGWEDDASEDGVTAWVMSPGDCGEIVIYHPVLEAINS